MGIFKEIKKSDGSGITTFYRLSQEFDTVTTDNKEKSEEMFDYNKALNKPSINGVYLIGNKTSEDLGLQPAGDYLTQVPEEYITETELGEYDSNIKIYIKEQINNIEHFRREIVEALPLVGKSDILYMVLKEGSEGDIYNEYIWIDTKYELIGTTAADLSDYYKKNEISELLNNKVDKVSGKQLSTNDYTTEEKLKLAGLSNYDDTEIKNNISDINNSIITMDKSIKKNEDNINDININYNALLDEVQELKIQNEQDISGVRLVKSGDTWLFYNILGESINYSSALNSLGKEDCILWYEDLENDTKGLPIKYRLNEDVINVYYRDDNDKDNFLQVQSGDGDNLIVNNTIIGNPVRLNNNISQANELPTQAYSGEIRIVDDTESLYIYNGSKWIPFDKNDTIDLSNYLSKTNTTPYTPTENYNPATKQYVDNTIKDLFIPTRISQLENDANFITDNTNTLENYYNKTNTYNKKEIDALLDASGLNPVSITLNGEKTNNAILYAPIESGLDGQILISGGNSANPSWVNNNFVVHEEDQSIKIVISETQPENPTTGYILWIDKTS